MENEEKYKDIKDEILGSDDEDDDSDGDDQEDDDEEGGGGGGKLRTDGTKGSRFDHLFPEVAGIEGIQDRTETNLVNLRKVIYLTIMNSLGYEEAVHKLMKVNIQEGQEVRTLSFELYFNLR